MERRRHGREFKLEAVKLIRERDATVAQAARDLGIHPDLLRNWMEAFGRRPTVCAATSALGRNPKPFTNADEAVEKHHRAFAWFGSMQSCSTWAVRYTPERARL